jgi:hypothetical protein
VGFARIAVVAFVAGAVVLLASLPAHAQSAINLDPDLPTGPREDSLHVWNGVAGGVNPLVLGDMIKVFRKMPFGNGETLLTSDSHWRLGAVATVSPTYVRPAILIGISPLLILDVDLHAGPGLNLVHYRFHGYGEDASPEARADMPISFGMFFQATANVLLKLAAWRVLLLQFVDVNAFYAPEPFYHWEMDTVVKSGFDTRSRTFLGFELVKGAHLIGSYEVYRYHESGWRTQWAALGFLFLGSLPGGTSAIVQVGQHIENEHFRGTRIWLALFWDWDFPLGPDPGAGE